jgi:hypothetical protein
MTRVGAVSVGRIGRTSIRKFDSTVARSIPGLAHLRSTMASWRTDRTDGKKTFAVAPLPHAERAARPISWSVGASGSSTRKWSAVSISPPHVKSSSKRDQQDKRRAWIVVVPPGSAFALVGGDRVRTGRKSAPNPCLIGPQYWRTKSAAFCTGLGSRCDDDHWPFPAALVTFSLASTALLCPFDPLIFFRPRVERLFGFHYRIEIYTPAAKRRYGYYVWPLLVDGHLVARVDLKADRASNTLRAVGAFGEPEAPRARVAAALAGELESMASWLGLGGVSVSSRGDLAPDLRAANKRVS